MVDVDQLGLADHSRLPSFLLGPAWDYDEATDEYYLHLYLTKQPDLNWDNVEVRESVYGMMRFWLDRGCDGFRVRAIQLSRTPFSSFVIDWVKMDVINLLSKADGLPDAPVVDEGDPTQLASMHYANGPRVHEYIKEMNKKVLSRALSSGSPPASGTHRVITDYDIFTVGEAPFSHSADDLAEYVLPQNRELQTIFHFELMDIDSSGPLERFIPKPWKLSGLRDIVEKWQTFKRGEGFWNTSVPIHSYIQTKKKRTPEVDCALATSLYIENHDQSRVVSRFGNDSKEWRSRSAKLLALFEVSQGGTLFVYQGQELGLKNVPASWGLEEYKDVATINFWNRLVGLERTRTLPAEPYFSFPNQVPLIRSHHAFTCVLRIKERRKAEAKPGEEIDMSDVMKGLQQKARDHSRVPMPVRTLSDIRQQYATELITERAPLGARLVGTFPRSVDRRSSRGFHYGDTLDAGERRLRARVERSGTTRRQCERSRVL